MASVRIVVNVHNLPPAKADAAEEAFRGGSFDVSALQELAELGDAEVHDVQAWEA